jgi:hypothetical protein
MEILAVIALLALVVVLGCAFGQAWAPTLAGLAFAGLAVLLLLSGYRSPWPEIGFAYFGGSAVELAAANEFWRRRGSPGGATNDWRATAALVAAAGAIAFVVLILLLAAALAGFYSQL